MIENIPLDLKIELGKLIHMEKFVRVKKELLECTLYLCIKLRPVHFKPYTTTWYILGISE
jgi:hypothetical protein